MPRIRLAGTRKTLGREVPASQQISINEVSHAAWNELLGRYVDDDGLVNYAAWQASSEDRKQLLQYLDALSAAGPTQPATREARLAFWINAYNAVTVDGILREYPTSSVRKHTARYFGYNMWEDLLLVVGGQPHSLSQIEHQVLRKMGDPRIHFGIVCASRGCPRLLNEAYAEANVDEQLDRNSRAFFADRTKFQYDAQASTVRVSQILNLFGDDFGGDAAAQLRRIEPFLPDESARKLAAGGSARMLYLDYDWRLNEQPPPGAK